MISAYAELHCLSHYSFLRGASSPQELVERAHAQGYAALAITDECSLAGVVRAHVAAKACGLKLLIGSEFLVSEAEGPSFKLVLLARHLQGYGELCQFITDLRRSAPKGSYQLSWALLQQHAAQLSSGCLALLLPLRSSSDAQLLAQAQWLLQAFRGRAWIGVALLRELGDELWLHRLRQISQATALPLVAAGDVHLHVRSRKPLQDVMTATRLNRPISACGYELQPNAERHLRSR
ncbi:MAG: PHP domain-containing protein, partial [Burkholderiaceae bacterium]|nr:PHP domain-containing protein [Burkholderiaceae bacterium]